MASSYYIGCTIERGAFAKELVFEIELSESIKCEGEDGGKLVGTAHPDHLRDVNQVPLEEDHPLYGDPVKGYVVCRKLKDLPDGMVIVEVPSADVIHVSQDSLIEY